MTTIEEMSMLLVKTVILIIGIVFLVIIFNGMVSAAYEQTAFASVEKLKSAIEEACFKGATETNPIEVKFELPQRVPIVGTPFLGALTESLIGGLIIRPSGDPAYVVYYEMFPPGEGITWELYHDYGYRAIGMLPENADPSMASNFIGDLENEAKARLGENLETQPLTSFIGNVEITDNFDPLSGEPVEMSKGEFFGLGEWEEGDRDRPNFLFDNYLTLSSMNKTVLKHLPCGDNSLCLKTTKGIYTFPLEHCADIDYIQFVGYAAYPPSWRRVSDFYFVSPCKIIVKVFMDDCSKNTGVAGLEVTCGACKKAVNYPMYRYDKTNDEFIMIGNHTSCIDEIGGDKDTASKPEYIPCVRVYFGGFEGHCFSYNEKYFPDTGIYFVRDSTEYVADNKFILKPNKPPSPTTELSDPDSNPVWP